MSQLDEDFLATFQRVMVDVLQVPLAQITVVGLRAGSVVVDFLVDISESQLAALPGSDVQGAILVAGEVGGYSLLSVDVAEVEVVEGDPCEAGDWESCTIGGQPLVVVAAAVVGVGVVLLAVLCKACCKKKAKEGMQGGATTSDYAQWN